MPVRNNLLRSLQAAPLPPRLSEDTTSRSALWRWRARAWNPSLPQVFLEQSINQSVSINAMSRTIIRSGRRRLLRL